MDMSVVEGEEKPVNVNDIPEYAAEIHAYLRELEVRSSTALLQYFALNLHFLTFITLSTDENQA